jgi:hypothetical protein
MGRIRGKKPSPAIVVSVVALVFAVAGTSVAGVATISVLNKKEKKQTRNIAKDEIRKSAPGLSVANATHATTASSATQADSATRATSAVNADHATTADSAQPVAYAHVTAAGNLIAAESKNIGAVTHSSTGVYCFTGIPFTPRGGQATLDAATAGAYGQFGLGQGCSDPNDQAFVDTFDIFDALVNAAFFVVFYG